MKFLGFYIKTASYFSRAFHFLSFYILTMSALLIAIDGPAASGKGTIARRLAAHYGLPHLDTGMLYRAVALTLLRAGFQPEDENEAIRIAEELKKGIPVSLFSDPELRSERTSQATSKISAIPMVRQHLLELQRAFAAQPGGAVLDGRDIGTVIAPNAKIKLFITASPEKRAERRWKELHLTDGTVTYDAVLMDMKQRDARDASRATAPTVIAPDAFVLDTSDLTVDESFAAALAAAEGKKNQLR
jgi:cytidylate kinase